MRSGSADEAPYQGSGIAHFVEHMVFDGTKRWPKPTDIEQLIKSKGGYINGFTSHDCVGFKIIIPSGYASEALEVMKEILTEAVFDPAEVEKEREVILKEVRLNMDEPAAYLSQLTWSAMFTTHNYRFPPIGREDLLKLITPNDLKAYYKSRYTPDNIVLGVAGDVDTASISKKIKELFGNVEPHFCAATASPQEPQQITGVSVREQRDVGLTYLTLGFHSVRARDTDIFSLDVLSMLLGSGKDSRLFKELYARKKLVYAIGSADYTPKDPGIFGITAVCKPENTDKVVAAVWDEVVKMQTDAVSEKELQKAKNQVLSGYIFSKQTVEDQAADLVGSQILTGDHDFSKKYVEGVSAVTKESLTAAAKKYLIKNNSTLVVLTPAEGQKAGVKKEIASRSVLANAKSFKLKNGLAVLLIEDRSLPIISVTAVGLGGLRTENFRNNGVANLVSETLLCGSRTMGEEETFSLIEGAGGALGSYSSSNSFGVSASGLSKDTDLILRLFTASLQDPLFGRDKIAREKNAIAGAITAIDDDIYRSGMRTLKYTLFRRHPYRFQSAGTPETLSRLSQADILDYYRRYYRPGNMVLVIAGDIDKRQMQDKITALLEKPDNGRVVEINPPSEIEHRKPRVITRRAAKEQSLVLLGYLGGTIAGPDRYGLEVMCSVLSGVNGRLSEKIRGQKGLAYALDVVAVEGIEPGMIVFYAGTTRKNIWTVKNEIFKEIERLKTEGITDEELKSAKSELIGLHKMGLQTIQDISMQAGLDELYGLGYDNTLKFEEMVTAVTKDTVLRTAQKYLKPDSYVLLTIEGTK
ncbi:MAG: pitrilysin family protein [Candidatus Omnitrophica bacterium]|nr:pitrilysin family protein [Candidatus Omnitrophota bacterium]